MLTIAAEEESPPFESEVSRTNTVDNGSQFVQFVETNTVANIKYNKINRNSMLSAIEGRIQILHNLIQPITGPMQGAILLTSKGLSR